MRRLARFFSRCVLYGTAAVLVVILGAFLLLQTDPVRSRAKALLESAVSDTYGLRLTVGRISGDFLFSITLEDVKLFHQQHRLLEARKISATYFAPLLLKKTLFVNEFNIQKGVLNLERGPDGNWNMAGLGPESQDPPKASSMDFRIIVRRAAIEDVDMTVVEKTAHEAVTRRFDNIGLVAGFSIRSGAVISADIYETRFALDQPQFTLRNLSGEIAYDIIKQRLQLKRVRIRSGESDLSVNGSADLNGADPALDVTAEITRLSLPEIGRLTSAKQLRKGTLSGRVLVKGKLDQFSHRLDLRLGRAVIRTEGTVIHAAGGKLDLDINGAIQELNLTRLAGFGLPEYTGMVNAGFRINGTHLLHPERRGVLELDLRDSQYDRYTVQQGRLRLLVDRGGLKVETLTLETPMGNVVVEGSVEGLFDTQKEKTIHAITQASQLDVAQISNRKDFPGKLNLVLRTEAVLPPNPSDLTSISGKIIGKITASNILDLALQEGDLDIAWGGGRLDLKRFTIRADSGRIALTGFAIPQQQRASVDIDLKVPHLEKIGRIAARFDKSLKQLQSLSGNIDLTGRFKGWWDRPSFRGTVNAKRIRFDQISAKTLTVKGQWNGLPTSFKSSAQLGMKDVAFNTVRLSTIQAAATLSPDKINIDLDATHRGGENLKLKGRIDQWRSVRKAITVDTLRMTAKAASKAGKLGTQLTNQGPIRAILSPHSLDIRSFSVVSDQAALALKGLLHAEKDSSLVVSLSRFNLDRISWLMPVENRVRGTLSADINVSGTGKKPILKAAVQVRNGFGYDVAFADLNARFTYNRSKLISSVILNLGAGQKVELDGKADIGWTLFPFHLDLPGSGLDVSVKTTALDLATLPIPEIPDLTYNGNLDLSLRLVGDPASPILKGQMAVKQGVVRYKDQDWDFSRLGISVDYSKAKAAASIALERGGQQVLTATGRTGVRFSLRPFAVKTLDKEMDGVLKIQNLDVRELSFLNIAQLDYGGRMDLSVTIAGRPAFPVVVADLSIHSGHLAMKNGSDMDVPFSRLTANLRYQKSKATADITLHRDTEQLLAANGHSDVSISLMPFQFKAGPDMDVSLTTRGLRLSALPLPKLPGADIDGKVDVTVRMQGDWKAPRITGDLLLKQGSLSVKRPSLTYENVSAEIRWIPGRIVIESISVAGDNEGSLRCAGDILLSGFKPTRFNVRLTGDDFFIPFHPAIRARIQPDILLAGSMDAPKLTGTITIPESRLNLDRFVEPGPSEIQVKGRDTDDQGRIQLADSGSQGSGFLRPLRADLNVVIPKNAWLKGQGLDAEVGGSINIRKESQKSFILLGSLNTIRGNYSFQGKLFTFEKGTVAFLGLEEPNPSLDFEATARIRSVDIIIRIGGTARDIRLSLDSDPSMEQTDIVSYIMFGKPSDSLNDRDSANVERAALGLTGQVAASELKSLLGDDFFLDTIAYQGGEEEGSRGSVAVGKYVTPDVFVQYRQGLSADQPSELEASYEVNKNIRIQTNVGNEKTTGIDVFWGIDF